MSFAKQLPRLTQATRMLSTTAENNASKSGRAATIAKRIPQRTWDSHMHVVDPGRYPLVSDAQYVPPAHTLTQANEFEKSLGISNMVLVQPSIYGFDNSHLLDALKQLGPSRGRGVVAIDPEAVQPDTMREWHVLGVRGVRLNLKSSGTQLSADELAASIRRHADAIRPWNWVLQLYLSMKDVPTLLDVVPTLGVRVCLDHFASPDLQPYDEKGDMNSFDPYSIYGFQALSTLLRQGNTFVKISGSYRLSNDPQMRGARILTRELVRIASDRLVFATDWPHTRFDGLDITPFVESCLQWCEGDKELEERLFRRNAEDLWDAVTDDSDA